MKIPGVRQSTSDLLSDFASRSVLVLGDAILDEYLFGDCSRISPEAPVPVLKVSGRRTVLGGAANTAANVVSLGGAATLIALVGNDEGGLTLKDCAARAGVRLDPVDHGFATLRKTRVVSQQQQMVRLDYEAARAHHEDAWPLVLERFEAALPSHDVVVLSDYAKGFVSKPLAEELIRLAKRAGKPIIVDPRPQHRDFYLGCDYITPNWKEARALLRLPDAEANADEIARVSRELAQDLNTNVVLTLGPHGIAFCSRDDEERFSQPTMAREVFDVSGAGDTVVAAFALSLASGADHQTCVAMANRAASVVVAKFGTATVTPDEILRDSEASRLVERRALAPLVSMLRAKGKRIVTVNGSFDVLHGGHLHILREAKQQGDILIVGINSDESVRGYKGPDRPVVAELRRAEMLLALRMVDYVHIFDESDPIAFIEQVLPDVHVNGAEYGENCIEAPAVHAGGGRIHLVDRIPGLSTSGLIESAREKASAAVNPRPPKPIN